MVHAVTSSSVDDRIVRNVLAIVYHDRPDVDEDEQSNIGELLEWEDKGKDMIR